MARWAAVSRGTAAVRGGCGLISLLLVLLRGAVPGWVALWLLISAHETVCLCVVGSFRGEIVTLWLVLSG